MDQFSKEDDTVLTCRIRNENGEAKVSYYPLATADIEMYMISGCGSKFDDAGHNYLSRVMRTVEPDRSQGTKFLGDTAAS